MAIITISRELAALGDETAHELTDLLHYRFVDKKNLEERMKSLGMAERKIIKYDERKPSFWASLSQDRDDYLHYLKTALFSEAGQGSCVFMGRGSAALLRGIPGVLSVFLSAPPEIRVERVKSYFHCDDRRARQIIDQSDRDREGFHQYFFEMSWKGPENYHLTLNTGLLHPQLCAALVKLTLEKTLTEETETASALYIKDLILGQQVVHHILFDKAIPIHFLEARVKSGAVRLFGVVNSQALVEMAVQSAKEVPAVNSVTAEIQVVQEYSVVP
ncbi:phospholipid-binding protein [Spirochaetia bacterium]|nr:phospholipid-binding protein [Spirochaetia bacterium]